MSDPHHIKPAELADAAEIGGPGSILARATLSPEQCQKGAGIGPQAVLDGLRANQNLAGKVLRQIEAAIEATTAVWDAESKRFVDRPDFKTRLAACQLYMEHTLGLPVQRSENLNINAQATSDQADAVDWSSAALRNAVRRMLEKADRSAAKQEAAQQPVRVA